MRKARSWDISLTSCEAKTNLWKRASFVVAVNVPLKSQNCSYWTHSVFHWLVMVVSVQIMIVYSFVSLMYAGIMLIERSLECMPGSLWKNCSLCVRDWILDIYVYWRNCCFYIRYLDLIIQFLKCAIFYCQSTEFVCMCHEFDIALDICTIRDIRHKISAHFNCVVLSRK